MSEVRTLRHPRITTTSKALGHHLDVTRRVADFPTGTIVELSIPGYAENGLGRPMVEVSQYHISDFDIDLAEGRILGTQISTSYLIFEDMNPKKVANNLDEVICEDDAFMRELLAQSFSWGLIKFGILKRAEFASTKALIEFLKIYHQRASWIEDNSLSMRFAEISGELAMDWADLEKKGELNY